METISNESQIVRFVVANLTNLICALAFAGAEAIEQNILPLDHAHKMLGAVLARVRDQRHNEAVR